MAIDQIGFSAARLDAPGQVVVRNARVRLALPANAAPTLDAQAASLRAADLPESLQGLRVRCASVLLQEPHWHCDGARLEVAGSALGALRATAQARLDSARGRVELQMADLAIAGGRLQLRAVLQGTGWQVEAATLTTTLPPLALWLRRWWQPPAGLQYAGNLSLRADATGHGLTLTQATVQAQVGALDLQNEAGTVVTEKLAAELRMRLQGTLRQPQGELQFSSQSGQALAGPVLLDFTAHPLQLRGSVAYAAGCSPCASCSSPARVSRRPAAKRNWRSDPRHCCAACAPT